MERSHLSTKTLVDWVMDKHRRNTARALHATFVGPNHILLPRREKRAQWARNGGALFLAGRHDAWVMKWR